MKMTKINIKDRSRLYKMLSKRDYILYAIIFLCLLINLDLFSPQPLVFNSSLFWKIAAVTVLILLLFSVIQWHSKKRKIIDILSNGMVVDGKPNYSDVIKPNRTSSFNVHLVSYDVSGKTYEVGFKSKNKNLASNRVIYKVNQPEKAIAFETLRSDIKKLIERHL